MSLRSVPHCVLLILLVLGLSVPAQAQISITASDLENAFSPGVNGQQILTVQAGETAKIQGVIDAIGEGGVYDFSTLEVTASLSENEIQERPFDSTVPDDSDYSEAETVEVNDLFEGFTTYTFYRLENTSGGDPDGLYNYGDLTPGSFITTKTTYTPPLRILPLPITASTMWESGDVELNTFTNGVLDSTVTASRSGEVIGYGDVVLPGGEQLPTLVHREVQIEGSSTTTAISFLTKTQEGTVTVLTDGNGNVIEIPTGTGDTAPAAVVVLQSGDGATTTVAAGETGVFLGGLLGASIEVTSAGSTADTLRGYRLDAPSFNNTIDDSGSPAGFPVVNVSQAGYWVLNGGAADATYEVCLDYGNVPGIGNEMELAVLKRENASMPWEPQSSTVDTNAQQVCADGLTTLSEFTVGGGESNPLPVDLAGFNARVDGGVVRLTWQTASETNSAGFEVQRSQNGADFTPVGFVESTGTETEGETYRYTDTEPPFEAENITYQLRQVDQDGTAQVAGTVDVALELPDQAALFAPFPNPVETQARVRYAVPRATNIEIHVYDVLGKRVATLVDRSHEPGRTEVGVDVSQWAAGTYFVRMMADGRVQTQQMVVVK